jgi:phosphate-selective porin OprO/OprP
MKSFTRIWLVALALLVAPSLVAQDRTVTGHIRSSINNDALPGASIWLRGSAISTTTDAQGAFRIAVPPSSSDVLVVSHPAHDALEVPLYGRTSVDVVLRSVIRRNQYGQEVDRTPLRPERRSGVLVLESLDESFRLWFDIRVQMDMAAFDGEQYNKLGNGVMMRRARLGLKTNLNEHWYAEWDVDFSKSSAEVKDMYMQYQRGPFRFKGGNFKENLSLERNTSSRFLTFLERPTGVNALIPDRNLGLQASYARPSLTTFFGVHFQDMEDSELVTTREDNNNNFGRSEGYSVTGKAVGYRLLDAKRSGVHLGLAGSYRTPKTDDVLNTERFDTRTQSNINRKKFLDTDRITNVDYHRIATAELAGFRHNVKFQSEVQQVEVRRTGGNPTATFKGAYASVSALLFGGQYRYDAEDAEFTQPGRGRAWGDVEVAARHEYVNLNSGGITGGAGEVSTLGVNYHVNDNVKLMLNLSFVNHDRFANGRNRLFVGRDSTGALTTNPARVIAAKGKGGENYRMLTLRFEVDF